MSIDFFSFERLINNIPKILPYVSVTFRIVIVGLVVGSLLGLIVAGLRINKIPVINQVLGVYISFMRGTPMLVQMMLLYYGLPMLLIGLTGWDINSWDKLRFVELTFIINEGAFLGELFRASIESVPYEQTEAAYSVGLNRFQAFTRIVLPQAFRIVLPAYGTDIIGMFHNTQIAFLLGTVDLIGRAKSLGVASGHVIESYIIVAAIYIICSVVLRFAFAYFDKKLSYGRGLAANGV